MQSRDPAYMQSLKLQPSGIIQMYYYYYYYYYYYAEYAVCYPPSVRPSVCHTGGSVING